MKKISILLIFGALFTASDFFSQTLFSDNFYTTATASSTNFSAWDNKDLTGSNPTNGKWQQWPASTNGGGLAFTTAPNGFAFFRSATIVSNQYVDDNLPEDAALELKNPFSCASATKVFVEFSQFWNFNTSLNARISLEYSYDKTTWQVLFTDSVMQNQNMFYGGTATPSRVDATAALAGKSAVYLRFRYKGSFSGSWAVDDLKVYVPFLNDLQVFNMTSPNYRPQGANQEFKFWVRNNGADPLTSFKADLFVNGTKSGSSVTVSGLNVAPATLSEVTMISGWNPTPGFYTAQVRTIGDINGSTGADLTPSDNNTNIQDVVIYGSTVVKRKPLYEIYTSSTCPPCKPGNEQFHSVVDTSDPNSYVAVKFQQDFPGTGDPYCTNETVNRRSTMYAINSIPRMEIDGGWDQNASSFTSALHNSQRALPSIVDMSGTYDVNKTTKKVTASINIKPLINLSANDVKLYIAIVEKETYDNVKTNGETKFEQVVKKMIPSETGIFLNTISATAINSGVTTKFDTSFTFQGSYRLSTNGQAANRINHAIEHSVENFDNLYVVAWVQRANKTVLQSVTLLKAGSGGGSTAGLTDSAYKSVDSTATAATSTEISKTRKLLNGTEYSWKLVDSLLPSKWDIESVCDNIDCYFMPITGVKKFTGKTDSSQNYIKVSINHKKSLGYGWAKVLLYNANDSAASAITTKFSLLVKKGTGGTGSVSRVEDAKDFYFSENNLYFKGDILPVKFNVVSLDGKEVYSQRVSSSVENIAKVIPHGIYLIEVEFKNGISQVLKVNF
jgi:hypothetical protein